MMQLFAVVLPALILFCGLCIDVGMIELRKLQMQTAADAAALGAEIEAERGTNNWVNIGIAEAGINGFTNGSNNTTVSIVEGANYGAYSGRYDAIQATITQRVHTIFMGSLNGGYYTITAQSSALMTPCIYTLGTGSLQNQSLEVYTGSLLGNSCPVYATTLDDESNGNIAVESVNISGSSGTSSVAGFVYPSPVYSVPSVTDPLAWEIASAPSFSSCGSHTSTTSITSGTVTLNPGTYCKGLNISGGANVTLNPGLYIITGGATWNNATVSGTGVTLFFTTGGGGGYGQFLIQNNSTVTLSAPNDSSAGGTPAILVFASPNWTTSGGPDFQVISSSFKGDGIWYIPHAGLEVWSCTNFTATNYLGVVADNIFTAGTQIKLLNNYSYVATGNPFRKLGTLIQ